MAELPKFEMQATGQVLKERKTALLAAKKELEINIAVLKQVGELIKQNQFYEKEIDGARGRIFMLLVAQTRNAEVANVDAYVSQIEGALAILTDEEKKAEKGDLK